MTDKTKRDENIRSKGERPLAPDPSGMVQAQHYNPYLWNEMPESEPPEEGTTALAGSAKPADQPTAETEDLIEALRQVFDPEIPVNIYDLGLIYDVQIAENGDVAVLMTLTAPACPVAGQMPGQVADALANVPGTGVVEVTLTWTPPWDKDKMSEDAKLALGIF
jgi:FeS assembly SUF system protein